MHWLQSWVNLGEVDLILILKISKKKRQLKQNHFRGHPRRGSFGACVPKVQPQQPCESALVPFDKHQGEPSARAGPTHIESLLQRIEDASKQNCQEIVKQLLGEVSRCCSLLEAKAARPSAVAGKPLPGGLKYRPDFMLWSVLLSDKLTLNCVR